jgi:hypothetical protein
VGVLYGGLSAQQEQHGKKKMKKTRKEIESKELGSRKIINNLVGYC